MATVSMNEPHTFVVLGVATETVETVIDFQVQAFPHLYYTVCVHVHVAASTAQSINTRILENVLFPAIIGCQCDN